MLNVGKVLYLMDTINILQLDKIDKNYLSYCIDNKGVSLDYLFLMMNNSRIKIIFELIIILRMSDEDLIFIQKALDGVLL